MSNERKHTLAIFYCQNVLESSEKDRQALEKKYGRSMRLFPLPCSGRLESVHLLRALEEFADAAYVITCPEGTCKYFEGNLRAKKRVETAKSIITSIGLEEERLGVIVSTKKERKTLTVLAGEIMERVSKIPLSPVLKQTVGS
ncbi:MAG: hydrogenase iron-sulfur subunit [Deltaproteobacteria bacterium]|nr:hydrogenase iron-sulfur subunit [Deltaproteobacteria bacterium]